MDTNRRTRGSTSIPPESETKKRIIVGTTGWYRAEILLKKLENSVINPDVKSLEVVSTKPSRPTSGTRMREILPVKKQLDTTSGEKPYLISLPVSSDLRKHLLNREEQHQLLGVVPKMALLKAGNITKIIADETIGDFKITVSTIGLSMDKTHKLHVMSYLRITPETTKTSPHSVTVESTIFDKELKTPLHKSLQGFHMNGQNNSYNYMATLISQEDLQKITEDTLALMYRISITSIEE